MVSYIRLSAKDWFWKRHYWPITWVLNPRPISCWIPQTCVSKPYLVIRVFFFQVPWPFLRVKSLGIKKPFPYSLHNSQIFFLGCCQVAFLRYQLPAQIRNLMLYPPLCFWIKFAPNQCKRQLWPHRPFVIIRAISTVSLGAGVEVGLSFKLLQSSCPGLQNS